MNNIVVVDFETVAEGTHKATDPHNCIPVQLAAICIDGNTLDIKRELTFSCKIQPPDIELVNDDSLNWHSKVENKSKDEIKQGWSQCPKIDVVWENFLVYLHTLYTKKGEWGAPILAGHNIIRYDNVLLERLKAQFGPGKDKHIFLKRDFIDTMNLCWLWLESVPDISSYTLDNLRDYFGLSKLNSHDALVDVTTCADIISRFLKFHRRIASKTKFKGSFVPQ